MKKNFSVASFLFVFCLTLSSPLLAGGFQEAPWKSQFSDMFNEQDPSGPEYKFSGDFSIEKGTRRGTLNVTLDIKEGWHGYSQKQLSGQSATVINVETNADVAVLGKFTPDQTPHARKNEIGDVEEFEGQVTWSAPIELGSDVKPEQLAIGITVNGQVCKQSCVQFAGDAAKISAKFSKYTQSTSKYSSEHGNLSGSLNKSTIVAGENVTLTFSAKFSPGWHIYKYEPFKREGTTPQPTIIYFTNSSGFTIGNPIPSQKPEKHATGIPGELYSFYHQNSVDWKINIQSDSKIEPGTHLLEGKILFQICTDTSCDPPVGLDFKVPVVVGEKSTSESSAVSFVENDLNWDEMMEASKSFWADQSKSNEAVAPIAIKDLGVYLLFAFLAGLILNAMPCVLPVIGLKVMSFVQQAGEKRGRIFLLNLVFSLGLLVVFWILATLSAFFGYGWGDWLTKSMTGAIIITGIVFAFGLSMLGVWEIPIPGLSGSNSISKKSEEEGLLGAFFLGILTTILATPCTGPMLIPAVTITAGQPPWVAYLIFTTIGLGMALPYLLVGIFPSLISWLPRPGAWMTTFKQITGFILMATVVFLMSSFSSEPRSEYLVAMLTTLLVIAFSCWWIGRTSLAAETSDQLSAWGTGLSIIAVGTFVAFSYLGPAKYELDWQQYTKAKLGDLRDDNRLVFIDFTGPN